MRTTAYDPSSRQVACEMDGCDKQMALGDSFSFVVVFATTGPTHIPSFQCPAEQHYACCPEHAVALAQACIAEHLIPTHAARAQVVLDERAAAAAEAESAGGAL